MSPRSSSSHVGRSQTAPHFGTLLKMVRNRHGIRQLEVLAHLSGWTQTAYSRLESGELAPPFDQLVALYTALHETGVVLTAQDRQEFLTLARVRIEVKKSHLDRKTDQEWEAVRVTLSQFDHQQPPSKKLSSPSEHWLSPPKFMETRHLIGREDWLASVLASLEGPLPKKVVVLQGPTGIGKSSELHRIAHHLLLASSHPHIVLCVLPNLEQHSEPEQALDLVLGSLLVEIGPPDAAIQTVSLAARSGTVLGYLAKGARPVLVCVDNAEHLLDAHGRVAPCWESFLKRFLRSHHHASLLLATKEWPGWYEGERAFVAERMIPPLGKDEGVKVLQRLGLAEVAEEHLQQASEAVGGVPLCLEWVASLAQEPVWLESWDTFEYLGEQETGETENLLTRRLRHLLNDPMLFGGPIADRLTPLLAQVIEKRLSTEAASVLNVLALANIPLGKEALQVICSRPQLLKELRAVSLLANHPQRVQVLPMVAAGVRARLSAEQQRSSEEKLIESYQCWLKKGKLSDREIGSVIAELATLYLKHYRLVEASEHLICYGWMSFNQGHGLRLAHLTKQVLQQTDWHCTDELECTGLVLIQILFPFFGLSIDLAHYADLQRIRDAVFAGKLALPVDTEGHVTQILMLEAMNEHRYEEAQAILEAYLLHLDVREMPEMKEHSSVIQKRAMLLSSWCDYEEERGEKQQAQVLREQAIAIYKQGDLLLSSQEGRSLLNGNIRKRRLANWLNYLAYHLNRIGQYEEALQAIERAIDLQEQGYVYIGGLAASYGEKSQILAELGRFQEALVFDKKAVDEVQRCAKAGDALSQEDVWTYQVNRGRLYLRLGRFEEAEQLLREALSKVHPRREIYRMFAKAALEEIEQWRQRATSPRQQLDWRWVERYRQLAAYDSFWWLTWAGPFTEAEQQQWDHLFVPPIDEATKVQLVVLLKQSRERELEAALAEQREPRLCYPAIEIEEVRCRLSDLLQLDREISQKEPHAIVRRLYHGAIEEELDFLRLIEATYEGDTAKYWECNLHSLPLPTVEEMEYALDRVRWALQRGSTRQETAEVSQQLEAFMRTHLHLTFAHSSLEENIQEESQHRAPLSSSQPNRTVSAQAAMHFFETVLHECSYDGWRVVIDPAATGARIEQGLRQMFLPEERFSLDEMRHLLAHELLGHVARCVAGERSLLGLLGIHTKNSLPTEEGLALYYERQVAAMHGPLPDDSGIWRATLAIGLASGVLTPPQTFLSVFTFLELFSVLSRLLNHPSADRQRVQLLARDYALAICLRTFRGVPDLKQPGICFLQDAVYLHGLRLIEQAVAQDEMVLDRLSIGVVALELLPDLQELGITSTLQPLRKLAYDADLDNYIVSFEDAEEKRRLA